MTDERTPYEAPTIAERTPIAPAIIGDIGSPTIITGPQGPN